MKKVDLAAALTGSVYQDQSGDYISLRRFSRRQMEAFSQNAADAFRACASAGMKLHFKTDSTRLTLETLHGPAAGVRHFALDVTAGEKMIWHLRNEGTEEIRCHVDTALPEGMKEITVWFPGLYSTAVREMTLDDGAVFEPVMESKKLLLLGDSITQGYTSDTARGCYANRLSKTLHADVLNQAIGGEVFHERTLDRDSGYRPDAILIAYGTNDWTLRRDVPVEAVKWLTVLRRLYPDTPAFGILPIWRPDMVEKTNEGRESFEGMRRKLARVYEQAGNITVIDTWDFVPHDPAYYTDHVHPNEEGMRLYAEELAKRIKLED